VAEDSVGSLQKLLLLVVNDLENPAITGAQSSTFLEKRDGRLIAP
jgi:hypothetical protein